MPVNSFWLFASKDGILSDSELRAIHDEGGKFEEHIGEEAAKEAGATLVKLDANPLDVIWSDQPEPPKGKVTIHDMQYAGVQSKQKLKYGMQRKFCVISREVVG